MPVNKQAATAAVNDLWSLLHIGINSSNRNSHG